MLLGVHSPERPRETYRWLARPAHLPGLTARGPFCGPHELCAFFGCGSVRAKGPQSTVEVFVVHSTIQLQQRVIPFFERNELRIKHDDFEKFADIVRSIRSRAHHRQEEFDRIVRLAYSMNARGKQRKRPLDEVLLGSSETVREAR
jgi:hypothetical protein